VCTLLLCDVEGFCVVGEYVGGVGIGWGVVFVDFVVVDCYDLVVVVMIGL